MRATEILREEHRVIEQVLNCLEKLADSCVVKGRLDGASAREALDFFRNFADRCHHGKEEGHLFPLLEARGFPRQNGPTGVMIHEHEEGRRHLAAMVAAVDPAEAGHADACGTFVRHARDYVRLLRQHIRKEDECLFPMADATLAGTDMGALDRSFDRVEAEEMGAGRHEKYLKLAGALADRLGVAKVQLAHAGSGCGCHGH